MGALDSSLAFAGFLPRLPVVNLRGLVLPVGVLLTSFPAGAVPQAPPPARTGERPAESVPDETGRVGRQAGETLYSIGDPRDDEQMYLELINYARADPAGEALRLANSTDPDIRGAYEYFTVDLTAFVAATSQYPVAQPLSLEPRLTDAARGHSAWMLARGIQSHDQTNPTVTTGQRITATGYPWQMYGESIYAYSLGPEHGHAGFEVDWGFGPGGMQDPPGHRDNNHQPGFREVGIGVVAGNGLNNTGPTAVTIDFAARKSPVPLVTGVAFFDLNGNRRYDLGEGIGGLTVNVDGSTSYAVTAASGGYAVPTANGARTVTFAGDGLSPTNFNRTITSGSNVKVDLILPYVAPSLTGPALIAVGQPANYSFTAVPGSVGYRGRVTTTSPTVPLFDGSNGLNDVIADLTGTPVPLVSRPGGGQAYHLTHANGYDEEYLELKAVVRPKANGSLHFLTRLSYASEDQMARLEVTSDDGVNWTTLWSQSGTGGAGDTGYVLRTVSLAPYAGKSLRVRFRYGFTACTTCQWFAQTDDGIGFHVDSIEFLATELMQPGTPIEIAPGSPFTFTPPNLGSYELSVQPVKPRGSLPYGAPLPVTASAIVVPTEATVTGWVVGPNGKLRVDFSVTGPLTTTPQLLHSPQLNGNFGPSGATLKTNTPTTFSFQYEPTGSSGFLKIHLP